MEFIKDENILFELEVYQQTDILMHFWHTCVILSSFMHCINLILNSMLVSNK